jgi:hypothetical protein
MWAFLLLVLLLVLTNVLGFFITSPTATIMQPLVLTSNSQTLNLRPGETTTANFTVANLNTTNTIPATATAILAPANSNITLSMSGVQTRGSFAASTDGRSVSFLPGGNTLVVLVKANNNAAAGSYTIQVSLSS